MRLLIGLLLCAQVSLANALPDLFQNVATAYQLEIDSTPTWARHPNRHLSPASLTKLMTALLVIEQGNLDQTTRISHAAATETGIGVKLKTGERYRLRDLLAATLLASANDACHALAEAVANNERNFVKLMNQRAAELGMHDTHFSNACGHDAKGHYSSANDLSPLAREIIRHNELLAITSRVEMRIRTVDGSREIHLKNQNILIGRYKGAVGLKSGYTAHAGKCMIAYAKRGEHNVLLVMLHGNDHWWDAANMLDIAFEQARQSH